MACVKSESSFCPSETRMRFARRFLRSLARVRSSADAEKVMSRRIRRSSYACMAGAVGTRRAWSRALMFNLRKRPTINNIKRKRKRKMISIRPSRPEWKLRNLVPGGQGMDTCRLLDETAHYVKCLAIQVQVMTTIAHSFSASAAD